ncbi:hypothetical protein Tco_1530142 [Tanacetum coccineum]
MAYLTQWKMVHLSANRLKANVNHLEKEGEQELTATERARSKMTMILRLPTLLFRDYLQTCMLFSIIITLPKKYGTELSFLCKRIIVIYKNREQTGESAQLINDMHIINMKMRPVQVDTKFLNSLPSEMSKIENECVAASRLPLTKNQLRTSSNLRNQAAIQDGRVTVQQVQMRQVQSYAGIRNKGNATSSGGNNAGGQERFQAHESSKYWMKTSTAVVLADPGIPDGKVVQTVIPNNAAFQTDDQTHYATTVRCLLQ